MRGRLAYLLLPVLLLWAVPAAVRAQEKKDSLVTLVSAKSAELIERRGQNYRKVIGPARFLHNNTYLLCDTALWNVTKGVIDAIGNVQIIQDRTRLTSNTLQYVVDDNLAKFRGTLVQLEDKDKNVLRTRYLDYNTKDSVAVFQNGASMRDKDGQIIESRYGSYDSKAQLFVFNDQVNMYMDTTFVKTSRLEYRSDLNTAYFGYGTDMWQDDNMLSANDGWYDRDREVFFFRRNVHLLTKDQETWSDTLYYYRPFNNVEMMGKVELMDTTRNVFALAGKVEYTDSLSRVKMTRTPAVMSISEENAKRDTVWFGADTILYRGIPRNKVDSLWVVEADKRLKDLVGDPVTEYRRKAAEAAAKKAEEEAKKDPNAAAGRDRGPQGGKTKAEEGKPPLEDRGPQGNRRGGRNALADTLAKTPADSLAAGGLAAADTTAVADKAAAADSVAAPAPVDTTRISFIWANSRVKLFRNDMQLSCDSLAYNDLDSLARLYKDPLVFNEGNRQYAADSIYVIIRDRRAERARLMSNAFISTQEDTLCYDQIKGTEMMAYFDSTRTLQRFDALGGATALFFLTENNTLATVNKVESKMLYAVFDSEGDLDKIYYFDNAQNDAYPVVQLPKEERYLKGFRWDPERRPRGPRDITPLTPRQSQRTAYLAHPHAEFKETDVYFPGHIKQIYKDIAYRDSMQVVRARQPKEKPLSPADDSLRVVLDAGGPADTTARVPETPPVTEKEEVIEAGPPAAGDSLAVEPKLPPVADSLAVQSAADTLALQPAADTLAAQPPTRPAAADSLATGTKPPKDEPELDPLSAKKEIERARKQEEKRKRAEERRRQKEEQERIAAEKQAEQEARWAEEERKYQEKQAEKAAKKLEKERKRKLRALQKLEKKAEKERRAFERILEKERAKAARKAEKNRKKELSLQKQDTDTT